jgi:hypothetical protein
MTGITEKSTINEAAADGSTAERPTVASSTAGAMLPDERATFVWTIRLALTSRAPWKTYAAQLAPGDSVRLVREPDNRHDPRAIMAVNAAGNPVGYLYAEDAGLLYLLLDQTPPLRDDSAVATIVSTGHDRRGPIVHIRIQIELASAAPLFTLIAILALKDEHFPSRFDFQQNPWLAPLLALHQAYRLDPDRFVLPREVVLSWKQFNQPHQ